MNNKLSSEWYLGSALIFGITGAFISTVFFPDGETFGHLVSVGIAGTLTQWSVWREATDKFHKVFMALCALVLVIVPILYLKKDR